jgi:small conductance mechanosensitive channel
VTFLQRPVPTRCSCAYPPPVRAIVEAHPRELAAPAPSVLLDRSAAENAIEIVVAFSTAEDETAAVKSDLIKAVHAALDAEPGEPAAR